MIPPRPSVGQYRQYGVLFPLIRGVFRHCPGQQKAAGNPGQPCRGSLGAPGVPVSRLGPVSKNCPPCCANTEEPALTEASASWLGSPSPNRREKNTLTLRSTLQKTHLYCVRPTTQAAESSGQFRIIALGHSSTTPKVFQPLFQPIFALIAAKTQALG